MYGAQSPQGAHGPVGAHQHQGGQAVAQDPGAQLHAVATPAFGEHHRRCAQATQGGEGLFGGVGGVNRLHALAARGLKGLLDEGAAPAALGTVNHRHRGLPVAGRHHQAAQGLTLPAHAQHGQVHRAAQGPSQQAGQPRRGLGAAVGVAGQKFEDEQVQLFGHVVPQGGQGLGQSGQGQEHERRRVPVPKRRGARQQAIEQGPQGPQVRGEVWGLPPQHLRREIAGSAAHARHWRVQEAGHAQVDEQKLTLFVDQGVLRLDVPVHDVALVHVGQRLGEAAGLLDDRAQGTAFGPAAQVLPLDQRSGQPRALGVHVQARHDGGVVQRGEQLGLVAQGLTLLRELGHLERHRALGATRPPDRPAPSAAQHRFQLVGS